MRLKWVLVAVAITSVSLAQDAPVPLSLPTGHGAREARTQKILNSNVTAANYANPHEAAIAALHAAYRAPRTTAGADRTINLLLLSAGRDPAFSKAVYNLGVMCARTERWDDAMKFYREVLRIDPDSETAKLASADLARVQLMVSLESTKEGRQRREYDTAFLHALALQSDPAVALDLVNRLIAADRTRWEGPALAGILEASLGQFSESAKFLESAGRLAGPLRRETLSRAASVARRRSRVDELLAEGDTAWEKKDFESAAKTFAEAWELSPGQTDVGMRAAVGYLLSDDVTPAIEALGKIKSAGVKTDSERATAMLQKLAPIDDRARQLADASPSNSAPAPDTAKVAEDIARSVGDLTTPEMRLAAAPPPDLLDDTTPFVAVPDDEIAGRDVAILSTESIFDQYQRKVGATAQPQEPGMSQVAPASSGEGSKPGIAPLPASTEPGSPGIKKPQLPTPLPPPPLQALPSQPDHKKPDQPQ